MTYTKEQMRDYARKWRKIHPDYWMRYYYKPNEKERKRKYYLENTEYIKEYSRNWRIRNKGYFKKYHAKNILKLKDKELKNNHGISLNEYNELLNKQNGKCAICGKLRIKSRRYFSVDHDHKTGKIRGLLCHYCNITLGNVEDNLEILQKAIEYLKNNV